MDTEKTPLTLPKEVADKFNLVKIAPGKYDFHHQFGVIDLTTISLQKAEKLVADGFKFLVAKEQPDVTPVVSVQPATVVAKVEATAEAKPVKTPVILAP
jgi:hypothetical protein